MAEALRGRAPAARRACASDAAALARLGVPGVPTADAWSAELARSDALAWVWGATPVGVLLARHTLDEIEVHQLQVAESHRRCGGADLLLQEVLTHAAAVGAARVHLEVRASNRPALACYAKHGFIASGRRPRYYPGAPPEDAVLLTRVLRS